MTDPSKWGANAPEATWRFDLTVTLAAKSARGAAICDDFSGNRDSEERLQPAIARTIRHAFAARREIGGPDRDQTDDLVVANDALYQLSYWPVRRVRYWEINPRK